MTDSNQHSTQGVSEPGGASGSVDGRTHAEYQPGSETPEISAALRRWQNALQAEGFVSKDVSLVRDYIRGLIEQYEDLRGKHIQEVGLSASRYEEIRGLQEQYERACADRDDADLSAKLWRESQERSLEQHDIWQSVAKTHADERARLVEQLEALQAENAELRQVSQNDTWMHTSGGGVSSPASRGAVGYSDGPLTVTPLPPGAEDGPRASSPAMRQNDESRPEGRPS